MSLKDAQHTKVRSKGIFVLGFTNTGTLILHARKNISAWQLFPGWE
mgnify:CR=1 FL=1